MNDSILRKLTAYVDGELSPADCDAVNRLLAESAEARQLLRALQHDAERLRTLKRAPAPINFAELVLTHIVERPPTVRRARQESWIPTAVAAAIVIGLGLGTFAVLQQLNKSLNQNGGIAEKDIASSPLAKNSPSGPNPEPRTVSDERTAQALKDLRAQLPTRNELAQLADDLRGTLDSFKESFTGIYSTGRDTVASFMGRDAEGSGAGEPSYGNPTYLTSPIHPSKAFKTVELSKLPLFLDLKEMESTRLVTRLREDKLHHIDLSCQESWKALERLQAACRASGIKLVVDADVTQRMNQRLPAQYMVYLENVPADLVGKVLAALQAEDRRAESRKKGDAQFESIMVLPLDDAGRKRLADSLGVSTSSLLPAKPKKAGPAGVDPTQPLSKETEKALDKLFAGQGRATGKEPTAVVLVAIPNRNRTPVSKEVKAHLDSRRGSQPEHVNVVFLLRPSKG